MVYRNASDHFGISDDCEEILRQAEDFGWLLCDSCVRVVEASAWLSLCVAAASAGRGGGVLQRYSAALAGMEGGAVPSHSSGEREHSGDTASSQAGGNAVEPGKTHFTSMISTTSATILHSTWIISGFAKTWIIFLVPNEGNRMCLNFAKSLFVFLFVVLTRTDLLSKEPSVFIFSENK